MTPFQLSAQFAAFLWFTSQPENAGRSKDDARRFARTNWERFLPSADVGVGRLLEALAAPAEKPARVKKPRRRTAAA